MSTRYQYQDNYDGILIEENVDWEAQRSCNNVSSEDVVGFTSPRESLAMDDTYLSTVDNTTQYFSVLDSSNEPIFNNIGTMDSLDTTVEQINNEDTSANAEDNQVVLYKVDGSDELYGVQIGHDESGNLQKYQFRVRQLEDGNLEALTDTIEVLPLDNEGNDIVPQEEVVNVEYDQENSKVSDIPREEVLIKQEQITVIPESDECQEFDNIPDTKQGIIEANNILLQKQELIEQNEQCDIDFQPNKIFEEDYFGDAIHEQREEIELQGDKEAETSKEAEKTVYHFDEEFLQPSASEDSNTENQEIVDHYEEMFIKESHLLEENGNAENDGLIDLKTTDDIPDKSLVMPNANFDEVNGAGPVDGDDLIRKTLSYQKNLTKRRFVKNVISKIKIRTPQSEENSPGNFYYLVRDPEKENLITYKINSSGQQVARLNPRSILKTSVPPVEPKQLQEDVERYDKRFAKSKEAQQARQFHNFIAMTKIIHAPTRQERLPRKQKIKPLERNDEEIVVQEVVVSSNGFVEMTEDGVLKERVPLVPTEFINLSDSDDEDGNSDATRRKPKKKPIEIAIIDSDEDDDGGGGGDVCGGVTEKISAIQITDSEQEKRTPPAVKKSRGRPPKYRKSPDPADERESPAPRKRPKGGSVKNAFFGVRPRKRFCLSPDQETSEEEWSPAEEDEDEKEEEDEEEIIVIKVNNSCPKCPKSFSSEGALRSHMQFHAYSNVDDKDRMKYICEVCGEQFKNNALLTRHSNAHKTNDNRCRICKRVFSDHSDLIVHRRAHVKEQMFKATTLPKDSPKRTQQKPPQKGLKCDHCGRLFTTAALLESHKRIHMQFVCPTCKTSFHSKLTLEMHIRGDCLKSPKKRPARSIRTIPSNKTSVRSENLNAGTTRSLQKVPKEEKRQPAPVAAAPSNAKTLIVPSIKCDNCPMSFATPTRLLRHEVLKHNMAIPNKEAVVKMPTLKPRVYGGVQSKRFGNFFKNLHQN